MPLATAAAAAGALLRACCSILVTCYVSLIDRCFVLGTRRKDAPGEDMEEEVFWAPAALAAFSAGQLNLARAGMTLGEAFESGRLPSENAPPVSGVKREGAGEEAGDREGSGGKVRKKAKREVDGGGVADGGGGGTKSGKKKQTKTD